MIPAALARALVGRYRLDREWLERAYAQRDAGLIEMKLSPNLRSLQGDPRLHAFLRKMGFED